MPQASTLLTGGLVLLDPAASPTRSDVLIVDDTIAAIGDGLTVDGDTNVIDASRRLIIPGFVNAHTHDSNLSRGAIDGLPLEIWLGRLYSRPAVLSAREVYVSAAIGAIEMVKTGTTCASDMALVLAPTDDALDPVAQAYADVGLRVSIAPQILDLSPVASDPMLRALVPESLAQEAGGRPTALDLASMTRAAIERWHGASNGRIRMGLAPTSPTRCSDELLSALGEIKSKYPDVSVQTHLDETRTAAQAAKRAFGVTATIRLDEYGLLGERTLLAHGVWLEDEDISRVVSTRATIVHNPVSNLKLGSGIAPVPDYLKRGCRLALGTDGSASSDNQNMFGTIRLAALIHRVMDRDYEQWPSVAQVLEMATVGGARAAAPDVRTGVISVGAKADLVLIDVATPCFSPPNDYVNQLVHAEVGSGVSTVIVDGRTVVDAGRVTTVDEVAMLEEAAEIHSRHFASAPGAAHGAVPLEAYQRMVYLNAGRGGAACRCG